MKYTTLDKIVTSILIQKSRPMHWYMQFLKYSADCLRELTFDTLQVVNAEELPVNRNDFTVQLPCDYVDFTKIGYKIGQFVKPIPEIDSINRLPNTLPDGQNTTFGVVSSVEISDTYPIWPGAFMFQNIDDLGENLGRLYGWPSDQRTNAFKIIEERGIIQLTESYGFPTLILEYISDGQCVTNSTMVPIYAQKTIESYADWQFKLHTGRFNDIDIERSYQNYKREWRKLRARISGLTLSDIRQQLWHAFTATIKN